jgi:hypothetical protein
MTRAPGPWIVGPDGSVGEADGTFIFVAHPAQYERRYGNATLAAAAPQMLAALQRVVHDDFESQDVLDICRAAIAAAIGAA